MLPDQVLIAIGSALIAGVVSVIVARITQRGNARQAEIESERTPYESLAGRVVSLEGQIDGLRAEISELRTARDEDRAYIRRVLAAWSTHLPDVLPPQPMPQWYLPHPSQQPKEHP